MDYSELWDVVDELVRKADATLPDWETTRTISWYISHFADALTRLGIERPPKKVCGACENLAFRRSLVGVCKAKRPMWDDDPGTNWMALDADATNCKCFEPKENIHAT